MSHYRLISKRTIVSIEQGTEDYENLSFHKIIRRVHVVIVDLCKLIRVHDNIFRCLVPLCAAPSILMQSRLLRLILLTMHGQFVSSGPSVVFSPWGGCERIGHAMCYAMLNAIAVIIVMHIPLFIINAHVIRIGPMCICIRMP